VKSGRYFWNSGIFIFRADMLRGSLTRYLPEIDSAIETAFLSYGKKGFPRALRAAYRRMPSISMDYGILEKEKDILLIPASFGWSDLGTWRSLHEFMGKPGENVAFGDSVLLDCRNSLVRTDRGTVAVVGLKDIVVVRSGDAVLVCPRDRSEEVKGVVEEVRKRFPHLC
jgi:mannose-1-phosphate guanylyltransferase